VIYEDSLVTYLGCLIKLYQLHTHLAFIRRPIFVGKPERKEQMRDLGYIGGQHITVTDILKNKLFQCQQNKSDLR